jgi:hypothetical protein
MNVGFLGAYTTFSSLALGNVLLFADGQWLPALLYMLISIVGGVVAVLLGDLLGHYCIRLARRPAVSTVPIRQAVEISPARAVLERTTGDHLDVQDDLLT